MPISAGETFPLLQDALIELFTLDLNSIGVNLLYRFCNHTQTNGTDVVFQTNIFTAAPITTSGFRITSGKEGQPKPQISISNVTSAITALVLAYQDLRGAKLIRQRTYAKYLDNGPTPDATKEFPADTFFVERKVSENSLEVVFELKTALEYGLGAKIPRRQMFHNQCAWDYRSAECTYTGPAVADINDNPTTDMARDECGLRLTSCKMRFGQYAELPLGSFPSLDAYRL